MNQMPLNSLLNGNDLVLLKKPMIVSFSYFCASFRKIFVSINAKWLKLYQPQKKWLRHLCWSFIVCMIIKKRRRTRRRRESNSVIEAQQSNIGRVHSYSWWKIFYESWLSQTNFLDLFISITQRVYFFN